MRATKRSPTAQSEAAALGQLHRPNPPALPARAPQPPHMIRRFAPGTIAHRHSRDSSGPHCSDTWPDHRIGVAGTGRTLGPGRRGVDRGLGLRRLRTRPDLQRRPTRIAPIDRRPAAPGLRCLEQTVAPAGAPRTATRQEQPSRIDRRQAVPAQDAKETGTRIRGASSRTKDNSQRVRKEARHLCAGPPFLHQEPRVPIFCCGVCQQNRSS